MAVDIGDWQADDWDMQLADMLTWCNNFCEGQYEVSETSRYWRFELESDKLLFILKWQR